MSQAPPIQLNTNESFLSWRLHIGSREVYSAVTIGFIAPTALTRMENKMTSAKLISISIERFKSHASLTRIDFGLLNVIIGRNNSGKSSVIQALLLLKQTLEFSRLDVPLRLEGYVDALSIRELTYGWPEAPENNILIRGPSFTIEWQSMLDVQAAISKLGNPDIATLASKAQLPWLLDADLGNVIAKNSITLDYGEYQGKTVLSDIRLESTVIHNGSPVKTIFRIKRETDASLTCYFGKEVAKQLVVNLEHFLPFMSINRRNAGPRDRQRSWSNAFYILFVESLEDLRVLIKGFAFLSSTRTVPPSLYSPSTEPIDNIGVSGEYAAQLLQSHQSDYVHFFLLPRPSAPGDLPLLLQRPLVLAVNEVLASIGVDAEVSIQEIKNAGFRLLFGQASLQHVGRGLTYLLPLVQLGLVSDPLRYKYRPQLTMDEYERQPYVVCAFEEPEAHLHPKVQSGLASWFVCLAMAKRQIIVETHSDHLVRRLRSMAARSPEGSPMEKWLLENVRLVSVEQTSEGVSSLTNSALTKEGGLENWPGDFMDESAEVEQEIYFASMEKSSLEDETVVKHFVHHESGAPVEGNS